MAIYRISTNCYRSIYSLLRKEKIITKRMSVFGLPFEMLQTDIPTSLSTKCRRKSFVSLRQKLVSIYLVHKHTLYIINKSEVEYDHLKGHHQSWANSSENHSYTADYFSFAKPKLASIDSSTCKTLAWKCMMEGNTLMTLVMPFFGHYQVSLKK